MIPIIVLLIILVMVPMLMRATTGAAARRSKPRGINWDYGKEETDDNPGDPKADR